MQATHVLCPIEVEAALHDQGLVPHDAPCSLRPGPTADLRGAMARFSSGPVHAARRANVEIALESLRGFRFADLAARRTVELLDATNRATLDAVADIGFVVPVETLAGVLGVHEMARGVLRGHVRTIAEVIGRGWPSSDESDEAATRLLEVLAHCRGGPVAAASLLYQCHDATAALFASMLWARVSGRPHAAAVPSTRRRPLANAGLGHEVILDLASFEFGVGPHACPGRAIAEAMVIGMLAAIDGSGWSVAYDGVVLDAAGRPSEIPLRPLRARNAR